MRQNSVNWITHIVHHHMDLHYALEPNFRSQVIGMSAVDYSWLSILLLHIHIHIHKHKKKMKSYAFSLSLCTAKCKQYPCSLDIFCWCFVSSKMKFVKDRREQKLNFSSRHKLQTLQGKSNQTYETKNKVIARCQHVQNGAYNYIGKENNCTCDYLSCTMYMRRTSVWNAIAIARIALFYKKLIARLRAAFAVWVCGVTFAHARMYLTAGQ